MNCLEFRRQKLTDPYLDNRNANEHRNDCATCRAFEAEIHDLDTNLREALTVEVPEGFAAKILLNQRLQPQPRRPTRWYWLGLAASFFAVVVGLAALSIGAQPAMAGNLLSHVEHERPSSNRREPNRDHVQQVFYSVRSQASNIPGQVLYASNCTIDGKLVAHLIVREGDRDYTVILVPDEMVARSHHIQNKHLKGMIVPHPLGSLAVITDESSAADGIENVANQYGQAIEGLTI